MILDILPSILNFVGAIVLGIGYLISDKEALEFGVPRWGGTEEENRKLPTVQERFRQRKTTIIGLVILFVGLILEILNYTKFLGKNP